MIHPSAQRRKVERAFEAYRIARAFRESHRQQLFEELRRDADLMQALYLMLLDLIDITNRANLSVALWELRARGWMISAPYRLTEDGIAAFWDWKSKIAPYLHERDFHALWCRVTSI
ncbi:hypothetical protein NLX83_13830 [Allokutzneria sp. A3M-2-11 16]|uniref:hypothetical protein n=1 Tax=Allokutzneria sp. A3M-2-11 16 TaxID=2962043 RepID=UPI0020B88514|nr:hypothetical protein [Allokutzneria sp. A3M-2-11 16]MCP3800339.1 hypothetical protein [Allokutzneria sp. A3M-2-11 16]